MITSKTKLAGLIGNPVGHSLSPAMHNAGFKHLFKQGGLDCRYFALPVAPERLGDAIRGISALNFLGANITIPYKEKALPFLDDIHEEARFIGAVNTIVNDNGKLIGHNTDGRGFMKSMEEAGVSLKDKRVLMSGAGGAARAITYYIAKEARSLRIFDPDTPKLNALVRDLKKVNPEVHAKNSVNPSQVSDIFINATPLGLSQGDQLPIDKTFLKEGLIVCDVIYKDTPLLIEAKRLGCTTVNGLGMLFWQGVLAFELWTHAAAPVEIMREALMTEYNRI
ncbi:shikimate dehydrogenase [Candidatus Magnetominusculus xianensis]|uniref:Shikimate dehydrogenase (NADP(+)) n=1 Tax=Candidatus Magnetominusculus xianensis TaxID=1748249 RepID=A0ABR5SFL8_9BACT|nr:shikimate dehydrogenase [Candidatus Magnetominusculus xianensis]KWT86731.1 shikimate dehydrogenase [Candidatus Magnetominusculus xianensis]MBF0402550.1 shikimate dehydrogenase [Nitrospirota bacterium]